MSWYLEDWQQEIYVYRVTILRRSSNPKSPNEFDTVATDIPCRRTSTPETDHSSPVGRTKTDNMLTLDVWQFPLGVEVLDGDKLLCTASPDTSDIGSYSRVNGTSTSAPLFANKIEVFARRSGTQS